jgi:capsular polysaccharide transport system permease protein
MDARRQQIFLQRIVEPNLPDKATMPKRLVNPLTVFGWSLLFYLIFWLVSSGLREHSAAHSK